MDIVAVTIGLLQPYVIRMGGEIYVAEMLLILVALFLLKRNRVRLKNPLCKTIITFAFLWLFGQVVTDIIRVTPVLDTARGFLAIIFFMIDFIAIYLLVNNSTRRMYILLFSISLGGILSFFIHPSAFALVEPWKFGVGSPIVMLCFLVLVKKLKKSKQSDVLVMLFLLLLGGVSIYLNARTMGGQVILTGMIYFLIKKRWFFGLMLRRISMGKILILISGGVGLVLIVLVAYQWIGSQHILPENAQEKYDHNIQVVSGKFGIFGIILSGRVESIASIPAIYDSPLIGHGSWAKDMKYRILLLQINSILGTSKDEGLIQRNVEDSSLIPTHSHLLGAWVWAGILGACFWFVVIFFMIKILFQAMRFQHEYTILIIYVCMSSFWNILFSPFGGGMRLHWGLVMTLLILSAALSQQMKSMKS